ncbi:MAG: cell division protein CrgA [Actinomycetota bacterium]|nr:cell division protein CrgA [Actinomycetota bacterium]
MPVSKGRKKANKRPTPPSKPAAADEKHRGSSPIWYVALMFGLMAVGIIVILLNYIDVLPGGTSNLWLLLGLGGIGVGFAMTLNYR